MRLGPKILTVLALVVAGGLAWLSATLAASLIEDRSRAAVKTGLIEEGLPWVQVHTDGLQVHLDGIAPNEAERFSALSVAGRFVDASRVIDGMSVTPSQPLTAPRFSVEILRNGSEISVIGLVPASLDREALAAELQGFGDQVSVTDLLEVADHDLPRSWIRGLNYALDVLADLDRAKISVSADEIVIKAVVSSRDEQRALEAALPRSAPQETPLVLDIAAPRPVISPFSLRFSLEAGRARFDSCSADTEVARSAIVGAAEAVATETVTGANCVLGLGVPTPEWGSAVVLAIRALEPMQGGIVSFADTDVILTAPMGTTQAVFDRVVGELESNLPAVFSLTSTLPRPPVEEDDENSEGPPEFLATLSPEGQVQLRGRLNTGLVRTTVESVAKSRFGVDNVYMAARLDETLPTDWALRVMTGLQGLSMLHNGTLIVDPESLSIRGRTGDEEVPGQIGTMLLAKLGEGAAFSVDVTYDEKLDPVIIAALPTPEECLARIEEAKGDDKIIFEPGSADLSGPSIPIVDRIASVLKECKDVDMQLEIGGHTDSQGRETMNLELSQARADAVLNALSARRVLVSNIVAKGYGETLPVADNDTEEGREANRRIAFSLVVEPEVARETEAETGPEEEVQTTEAEETEATAEQPAEESDAPAEADTETGGEEVTDAEAPTEEESTE